MVNSIYFSPSHKTKEISNFLAKTLDNEVKEFDLILKPIKKEIRLSDISVFASPTFYGQIPKPALKIFENFIGNNTPAIVIGVFGNVSSGKADKQLAKLLTKNGFIVIASANISAKHSLNKNIASTRPNEQDFKEIEFFVKQIKEKLTKEVKPIILPEKEIRTKNNPKGFKFIISDSCDNCGICAAICPTGAINKNNIRLTDREKCINCTTCIVNCPKDARSFAFAGKFFGKLLYWPGKSRKNNKFHLN